MAGPHTIQQMTEILRDRLAARHEKVNLAVFNYVPVMHTVRAVRTEVNISPYFAQYLPFQLSDTVSLQTFSQTTFLRLMGGGFQQGFGRDNLKRWLGQNINPTAGPFLRPQVSYQFLSIYTELWLSVDRVFAGREWSVETNGEMDLFADSQPLGQFMALHRQDIIQGAIQTDEIIFGVQELDISSEGLDMVAKSIAALKQVADKVVVYYVPEHFFHGEGQWPDFLNRNVTKSLQIFRNDPSIVFIDYSNLPLKDEDFADITHLMPSGKEKLNRQLALDLAPLLKEH